jgi:hypothetical protein
MNGSADNSSPLHLMRGNRIIGDTLLSISCIFSILLISTSPFSVAADGVLYEQKLNPYPFPITCPVTIANKTYLFVLDTGASGNIADPTLKPFLGAYVGDKTIVTLGNNINASLFKTSSITMGAWKLLNAEIALSDFQGMRNALGLNIKGVIGAGALRDCALAVDFDRQTVKALSGNVGAPVGASALKVRVSGNNVPVITEQLGGRPREFIIDTGANAYIGLQHDTFLEMAASGIIATSESPSVLHETASGHVSDTNGYFTKGQLLGLDLKDIPVVDTNSFPNNIGMSFLLGFNFTLDLMNERFYFEHRRCPPPIRFSKMIGAILKFSTGSNHVYQLIPGGGAAQDAGIKVWDHIVRLGSLKEGDIDVVSLYELCLHHAGETLEVEIERAGEEKPLLKHLKLPAMEYVFPPR